MFFDVGEYDVKKLPPLSPEDAAKPYAKYYYEGRTELADPELLEAIKPGNPISPELAVYPEQWPKLLEPGCPRPKVGYCLLPEGVAYACARTEFPDVTMEMENWFIPWVMGDPGLRYKIWYPGAHEAHYDNFAIEDFGAGMVDLVLGKRPTMAMLGLPDNPSEKNPKVLRVMSRNGRGHLHGEPLEAEMSYSIMLHIIFAREGGGLERWSFGYTGAHVENGKMIVKIRDGETITEEDGRRQASHLLYEYRRQSVLLPKLYAEFGADKGPKEMPPYPEYALPLLERARNGRK